MITLTFAQKENIGFQYVLDLLRPSSPYGEELVRNLKPLQPTEKTELLRQLGNVHRVLERELSCQKPLKHLLTVFMTVKNVRATVQKCMETTLNEIELFNVKSFLLACSHLLPLFREIQPILQLEGIWLEDTDSALDLLDPEHNRVASFFISDSSSQLLHTLRKEKRAQEERIRRLPAGEERDAAQALRRKIAAEEEQEEMRIRTELSASLRPHIPAILHNMDMIGQIDLTVEKARLARRYGGVMPVLAECTLDMTDMVNPKISDLLEKQGKSFAPVSIALGKGTTVITGANMGGKSVALKTIALNVLLIHCGFLPFAKLASVPLFDSIHIISEDRESIDCGLSSFGGEIVCFNQVVDQLKGGFPLILLDEFARGTNPDEGAAIVQSVAAYLNRQNAVTVLATHYDDVARWGRAHYQVIGLKEMDVEKLRKELAATSGDVGVELIGRHMDYGLYQVTGELDCPRDALNICRLLGMKTELVEMIEKNLDKS